MMGLRGLRNFGLRHSTWRGMGRRTALQRNGRFAVLICGLRRALHMLRCLRVGRLAVRR